MNDPIIRVSGVNIAVGKGVRDLNANLFSGGTASAGQGSVAVPKSPARAKGIAAAGKRIRQSSKPLLNKLETEFQIYEEAKLRTVFGDASKLIPQSLRFKLGNGIWFKVDFIFIRPAGTWSAYEVKGPKAFRGGFENLKVAAFQYPLICWLLVWKDGGRWKEQKVKP